MTAIRPDEIDFLHNEFTQYERRIEKHIEGGSEIDFIDIYQALLQAVNKPAYTRSVLRARHPAFMKRLNGSGDTPGARIYDAWAKREFRIDGE